MSTITIDLDSLSPEKAEKLAGFLLAYVGAEEIQITGEPSSIKVNFDISGSKVPTTEELTDPRAVFSQPITASSTISAAGPTLVIPNPPSAPDASKPAPVAGPIASTAGVIVDKSNLPWDSRIHSSAKSFNADGTWRARRGLPEGYVPRIEAELRQLMAIPSPQGASAAVAASPVASVPTMVASIPNPPLPGATASPSIQPYLDLMNKVSSALAGGRITSAQLQKVCDAVGLPTFVSLGTRLDLVPAVAPMIEGILAGTAV